MLRGGDAWKNRGSVLNQCSVLLRHPLVFHERERVTNNTNYEAGMGAQVYIPRGANPYARMGAVGRGGTHAGCSTQPWTTWRNGF